MTTPKTPRSAATKARTTDKSPNSIAVKAVQAAAPQIKGSSQTAASNLAHELPAEAFEATHLGNDQVVGSAEPEPLQPLPEVIEPAEPEPLANVTSPARPNALDQPIAYPAPAAAPSAAAPAATSAIDIVTGTIGGVGKTQFAHLLSGYYFNQMLTSGQLQPFHLVEGDHKGTKFYDTYSALPAPFTNMVAGLHQTVLSDDPAKQSNSDFIANLALASSAPVIINTPANSAEAMTDWLLNSDIPELCKDAGIPLRYWFVCRNSPDSLNAFADSFNSLGDAVPHILVRNQFSGQVQQSEWGLPTALQAVVDEGLATTFSMPALYVQNQLFSERFHLPFEVARAYDPESFSLAYWQKRLAAGDLLITRWLEWTGGTVADFLAQWQDYWQAKGLLYTGGGLSETLVFMKQHNIPLASVGRNRLNKFLAAGYSAIAQGLA